MSEVRLIDANALKEAIQNREECIECTDIDCIHCFYDIIDNAPTIKTYCYFCGQTEHGKVEEKTQGENALLKDIAHSLAIIADNSMKEGNTQESGNEMLRWVHSEAHRVMCPKCGCRVSMTAAYEMNYCFKCGAKLGGIKNDNS